MDKFDRIQQLHRLFKMHQRPVSLSTLAARMECTQRTVKRTIETMQNFLDAPIEYNRAGGGWQYVESPGALFELPGLWLTADELQSLTLLLNVLENLGNGLLNKELGFIDNQISRLLAARGIDPSALMEHIKVLPLGNRQLPGNTFQTVGESLLNRRRINIHYKSFKHQTTRRDISPQTLVYYRENWYLDAWCHLRGGLRTFSIARILRAETLPTATRQIPKQQLEAYFAGSYGIFAGTATDTARLRFFPEIAREIALQQWHPHQIGQWDGEDYLLSIPYSSDKELVQDILRHSPNVYIEAPAKLRQKVQDKLQEALALCLSRREPA
ncbi:WYL domain-containing transcriptional regulator [Exilibacterium tricleocarpae]|uniref:WYL domain-containing transcriptional regulator n=1 Tax=Exilibacterium tricleocarpae TaxID=2591008 RepID=A0A545TZ20_9GAMM|nr:WYL domain-containing transcriptional regulator [Exilibacterium tricleocarpae]TQV82465.1 WYL domain-containing transcriptional regulator [Exilibacterium tricleocarpae]